MNQHMKKKSQHGAGEKNYWAPRHIHSKRWDKVEKEQLPQLPKDLSQPRCQTPEPKDTAWGHPSLPPPVL